MFMVKLHHLHSGFQVAREERGPRKCLQFVHSQCSLGPRVQSGMKAGVWSGPHSSSGNQLLGRCDRAAERARATQVCCPRPSANRLKSCSFRASFSPTVHFVSASSSSPFDHAHGDSYSGMLQSFPAATAAVRPKCTHTANNSGSTKLSLLCISGLLFLIAGLVVALSPAQHNFAALQKALSVPTADLKNLLLHGDAHTHNPDYFPVSELALLPKNDAKILEELALRDDFRKNLRLLRAAGGLNLSKIPRLGGSSEMLGGWAAEERILDRLQKNAEENLRKDPAASDSDFNTPMHPKLNTTINSDLVLDDSGERVPEETLRAEAAALGYKDVSAWKKDFFSSSLKRSEVSESHRTAVVSSGRLVQKPQNPIHKRTPQAKLLRRSIATDFLSSMGKLFGSFFKQEIQSGKDGGRVQELFHLEPEIGSQMPERHLDGLRAQSTIAQQVLNIFSEQASAAAWGSSVPSESNTPTEHLEILRIGRPQRNSQALLPRADKLDEWSTRGQREDKTMWSGQEQNQDWLHSPGDEI